MLWGTVLIVALTFTAGRVGEWVTTWASSWQDKQMGGSCKAFLENEELAREYLGICTDEVLHRQTVDGTQSRYETTRALIGEMVDGSSRAPSQRQLEIALMTQWGGACKEVLSTEGTAGLHPSPESAKRIGTKACLLEMRSLHPRAWSALIERHWRLADEQRWEGNYPTDAQLQRALDADNEFLGVRLPTVKQLVGVAGYVLLAALGCSVLFKAGPKLQRVIRERRRSSAKERPRESPKENRTNRQEAREQMPRCWQRADAAFTVWFTKHFGAESGLYRDERLRRRIREVFLRVVEDRQLDNFDRLWRQMRATFHPDTGSKQFSPLELTDIFQYIGQNQPVRSSAA
jgi:hypothetical protein